MPKKIAFITQVRTGSTRLPGKILEIAEGDTLLSWFLRRSLKIRGVDEWVVATTESNQDNIIVSVVSKAFPAIRVVRGSESDVLQRYAKAIRESEAGIVVRIASDCPFLDWELVGDCLEYREKADADVVKTRREDLPVGLDVEVFRSEALLRADREATEPAHREHVGPYVYENPGIFRVAWFPYTGPRWPRCRLTLDYREDLDVVRHIYGVLSPLARASDIREYLGKHPEVATLNLMHVHP